MKLHHIAVVFLSIVFAFVACTAQQAKEVASIVAPIAQTVCDVATSQPEPAWVSLTCQAIDTAGKVVQTFDAKVPRPKVAAAACPRTDGKPTP